MVMMVYYMDDTDGLSIGCVNQVHGDDGCVNCMYGDNRDYYKYLSTPKPSQNGTNFQALILMVEVL